MTLLAPRAEATVEAAEPDRQTIETAWVVFVFVVVTLALNMGILLSHGVPVHGDITFPWRLDNLVDLSRYMFNDHGSVTNIENVDRALILQPLTFVARALGLSSGAVFKAIFVVLPFLAMVSSYALNRELLRRVSSGLARPAALVPASILYSLSPWVIEQVQAYLFWLAYALTPALVLCTLRLFESPTWKRAVALAILLTFIAATPQYLLFSALIVLTIAVFQAVRADLPTQVLHGLRRRQLQSVGVVAAAFAILNASWLLPVAATYLAGGSVSPGYEFDPSMSQVFSTRSSALNVLRGFDQWIVWYGSDRRLSLLKSSWWTANSLVVPAVAAATLCWRRVRARKEVVLLFALAFAFALLALGTRNPVYDWLAFRAQGVGRFAWVVRVPGKMSYLLWLVYSTGLAIFLGWLGSRSRAVQRIAYAAAMLSVAVLVLPKAIVYFYDYYRPVPMPVAYRQLENFLETTPESSRVLYLAPYHAGFGRNRLRFETSFTWNPRRMATSTPYFSSPRPSLGFYHLTYRDWERNVPAAAYPRLAPDLGRRYLADIAARYVVYHDDIVGTQATARRELAALRRSDLREVAVFGGFVHVFENPSAKPVVRLSPSGAGVIRSVVKEDPTRYRFNLATSRPSVLVLAQPFDPVWRLEIGSRSVAPREFGPGLMAFPVPAGTASRARVIDSLQRPFELGTLVSMLGLLSLLAIGWIAPGATRARPGIVRAVGRPLGAAAQLCRRFARRFIRPRPPGPSRPRGGAGS